MNVIKEKFKEVLPSVLPIVILVLLLHFTLSPLETPVLIRFITGSVLLLPGLTIFLIGVDIGITPIGAHMGKALAKTNMLWFVIAAGFFLGFLISVAEPDLYILASEVETVSSGLISKLSIVVVVSIGIAFMLALGLIRIVYNLRLYILLTIIYLVIFALSLISSNEFLAISFDASGATTGALTVPFMLSLSLGISRLKKDSKASEKDSFGLLAIASTGAIIAVMFMGVLLRIDGIKGTLETEAFSDKIFDVFINKLLHIMLESFYALLPIVVLFLIAQKFFFKISKTELRKILFGILFTFIGLSLFLLGVNAGFMNAGSIIGYKIASMDNKFFVIAIGFILGLFTILAEPAVYALTHQIEEVTSGYVKRRSVLFTMSIGVGIAIALSVVRILIPKLQLWQYLLPGYAIALILTYIVPKLFVGIAFDSGGVASGPMTATFILAYTQGVAEAVEGADVLVDGFGVIAMVAMTPLIALQILGLIFKIKSRKGKLNNGNKS